jgi:hypothetical protein
MAAPIFRSEAHAQAGPAVYSLAINKPTGTTSGDILLAHLFVYYPGIEPAVTPPSGWALLPGDAGSIYVGTNDRSVIYYKVAGGSEPTTYTWTFSELIAVIGDIAAYSGGHATYPINACAAQATPQGTSHSTPSITTTATDTLLVTAFGGVGFGSITWTPPSGETERVDQYYGAAYISQELNDESKASIGSTGAKTATSSVMAMAAAHIIALTPLSPTYYATLTDGVLPVDTCEPVKKSADYHKTLADAIQVSGVTWTTLTAIRLLLDTLGVSYLATGDECTPVRSRFSSLADTIALVNPDALKVWTHCLELLDAVITADNALFPQWQQLVDTMGLIETFIIGFGELKTLTDSIGLTVSTVKATSRSVSDALAMAEALARSVDRYLADQATVSDGITRTRYLTLTDSLQVSEDTVRTPAKLLGDTIAAIDLIGNSLGRLLADSLHFGDASLSQDHQLLLLETLSLAGGTINSLKRALADLTTLLDVILGPPRPKLELIPSFRSHLVLTTRFRQHLNLTSSIKGGGEE